MKPWNIDLVLYLTESNAIEGVRGDASVKDGYSAWDYLRSQTALSHEVILETHRLYAERTAPEIAGRYRDCYVEVGGYAMPHFSKITKLMDKVIALTPTIQMECLDLHIDFEHCHPFIDFNGRVGRLIYFWHCLQIGIEPFLFTAQNRWAYYALFKETT